MLSIEDLNKKIGTHMVEFKSNLSDDVVGFHGSNKSVNNLSFEETQEEQE